MTMTAQADPKQCRISLLTIFFCVPMYTSDFYLDNGQKKRPISVIKIYHLVFFHLFCTI